MLLQQIQNPANPWHQHHVDFLGDPPPGRLVIYEEESKSIVSENKSPDIPFRYSVNPYRGCMHACAYCYARPSHQYLDFGAGTDFETKIVVKTNAAARLRQTFERASWKGETICFSGNTDCYQPLEATYGLTRECLVVCSEFLNPVVIITKGSLIRRDIDVLEPLAQVGAIRVWISVGFDNETDARKVDRGAPAIAQRLKSMAMLREAGIPVGVSVSPIIPGLNDAQLPSILEGAAAHGADAAFMTLLRLPAEVNDVFEQRIVEEYPLRAGKILHGIEELRGGARNNPAFGERMRGQGSRWRVIESLFAVHCARLGLNQGERKLAETTFRRPTLQMSLLG